MIAPSKLEALKAGKTVVTSDAEMDDMEATLNRSQDGDRMCILTLPNPKRCGLHDSYIAWIKMTSGLVSL